MVVGFINNVNTQFIIDTGSGVSIISGSFFDSYLRDDPSVIITPSGNNIAKTVNGEVIWFRGECEVDIKLGTQERRCQMKILDKFGSGALLGTTVLDQFGMKIDIHEEKIEFQDGSFI